MSRRNQNRARTSSAQRNKVWTALSLEEDLVTITPQADNLVEEADWSNVAGMEHATLLAIRGWICATFASAANPVSLMQALIMIDDEIPPADTSPRDVGIYVNEQILWTGGVAYPKLRSDVGNGFSTVWDINVKAKRKITSGDAIRYIRGANIDNNVEVNCVLRALLLVS